MESGNICTRSCESDESARKENFGHNSMARWDQMWLSKGSQQVEVVVLVSEATGTVALTPPGGFKKLTVPGQAYFGLF